MQAPQCKTAWFLPSSLGESWEFPSSGLIVLNRAVGLPENVETARRHDAIENDVQIDSQTRFALPQNIFRRGRD